MRRLATLALCMAMSADGKIAGVARSRTRLGSERDLARLYRLRAEADAVIMGAATARAEPFVVSVREPELQAYRRQQGKPPEPLVGIVSGSLDLPLTAPIFTRAARRPLVFTTRRAPSDRVAAVERVADVLLAGETAVDPRSVVAQLERLGARHILLEGGGDLSFQFFQADLVDELFLTVTPWIVGGAAAPTPCDGEGFPADAFRRLQLLSCQVEGEEVFLHYRVLPRAADHPGSA